MQAATAIAESCFVISVHLLDSEPLPNRGRLLLWAEGNPLYRAQRPNLIKSQGRQNLREIPLHRWGWGRLAVEREPRPTSAESLQRLPIVIVIRAAKRREREDSQIEQRRCGVEWLTKS